jgi:hypothetical protein
VGLGRLCALNIGGPVACNRCGRGLAVGAARRSRMISLAAEKIGVGALLALEHTELPPAISFVPGLACTCRTGVWRTFVPASNPSGQDERRFVLRWCRAVRS